MNPALKTFCASLDDSIEKVIQLIDLNKEGIALIVAKDGTLLGTITDGDIRRFLLKGGQVQEACEKALCQRPVTAKEGIQKEAIKDLLEKHRILSIPIVNSEGKVVNLIHLRDLLPKKSLCSHAVVMAGGEGKRLRPLTENIPKPMVKVGDKPILENIIENLRDGGVEKVYLAVNYQAEVIENYFGKGEKFGLQIEYLREEKKMGTAGALSLLPQGIDEPILVMNGDVVTKVNFRRMFEFFNKHHALFCVAASEYHLKVPFGVLELANHFVLGVNEKPSRKFLCNAGIYLISPEVLRFVPPDKSYDMTRFMEDVIHEGLPTVAFPIHEYWVDVGQKDDLNRARREWEEVK